MTITTLSPSRQIHAALRFLAGIDDGAATRDNVGFNGTDTVFGQSLAKQNILWELQLTKGLSMLRKYEHTQLNPNGYTLPTDAELNAELGRIQPSASGKKFARVIDAPLTTDKAAPSTGMATQPTATIYAAPKSKNTVKVAFKYDPDMVQVMRDLDGKFNGDDKTWSVHIDKMPIIVERIPGALIDESVKALHAKQQSALTNRIAAMDKLMDAVGDLNAPLPSGRLLFEHQKTGVAPLINWYKQYPERKGHIFGDVMGLGKTTTIILVAKAWKKVAGCQVLVLCPASVKGAWKNELAGADLEAQLFSWGSAPKPLASPYILIADEAHYAQAGTETARGKRFLELAEDMNCLAVYPVSGTPMCNGMPKNFWPLLKAIGVKEAQNKREYEKRFCAGEQIEFPKQDRKTGEWTRVSFWKNDGISHLEDLYRIRATCMLRRDKDAVDLPSKLRTWHECAIDPKSFKVMREKLMQMRVDYEDRIASGDIQPEAEALVLIQHLRVAFSIAKVAETADVAAGILDQGNSVVIFADFKQSARRIAILMAEYLAKLAGTNLPADVNTYSDNDARLNTILSKCGVEYLTGDVLPEKRPAMIERFQSGQSRVFVSTIRAGGVGITLTKASEMVMCDRTYSPEANEQAEDRIHRIGQKNAATIINITACAMDEYIDDMVARKAVIAKKVLTGEITDEEATKLTREIKFSYVKGLAILDEIIGYKKEK